MALSVMMEDEETMIVSTDELLKKASAPEPAKVLIPVERYPVKHRDLTIPTPNFKVVARVNERPLSNSCLEIGLGEHRLATMPSGPRPTTAVQDVTPAVQSSSEDVVVSYSPDNRPLIAVVMFVVIMFVAMILSM